MKTIGQRIEAARAQAGLSRAKLGEKSGTSVPGIYGWERKGKIPKPDSLQKLAEVLGVSAQFLATGEGTSDPKPSRTIKAVLEDAETEIRGMMGATVGVVSLRLEIVT